MSSDRIAERWDAEYQAGRYSGDQPVRFVQEILAVARGVELPSARGLYIGCGNGRNFVPLVAGGLDLVGLDVSEVALRQLAERSAVSPDDLICGDLSALEADAAFAIVVGIQVFQHGLEADAHAHLVEAARRLLPGGLFCVRVNAAGTDIAFRHSVVERNSEGGFTIEY